LEKPVFPRKRGGGRGDYWLPVNSSEFLVFNKGHQNMIVRRDPWYYYLHSGFEVHVPSNFLWREEGNT